ncbi:hypothetical protein JQC91_07020 [Jannaschia sp. Os4]|uniref:hypothetical protein n=1 Tax=Jannaschia sp. Os4 TaxID=2807617 RepID=UPI0019397DDF|nr:hypothetical protein [Jannaschia sp. Os4]MBM2576051.1 hypothetical protein [Jannaschia sp. Os4]
MVRIMFLAGLAAGMGLATLTAALPLRVAAVPPGDYRAEAVTAPVDDAGGRVTEARVSR